MKSYVIKTVTAACLAAAVGPAFANASSSATFGNLVITLTDLNPNDGIAPSLSFQTYGHASVLGQAYSWGDTSETHGFWHIAPQQQGTLSGAAHADGSVASASVVAADNVAGFTSMSASGMALSGIDAFGAYKSSATGQDPYLNWFTLSANTMVTFSTKATLQAQTTIGYNLDADQGEFARAYALLSVDAFTNDGLEHVVTQERGVDASFNVRDDGSTEGVRDSWSGQMSISFSNDTASEATGDMQGIVAIEGVSASLNGVSPVPEPATYAMLLGGLALLGCTTRRR
jgi:hypothetical protein